MIKKIQDNLTNIVVILGLIASIGAGFTKFAKMESTIEQLSNATAPDLSGIETNGFAIIDQDKEIAIMQKEIEVLNIYREIYNQGVEPKVFINDFLELLYYFKNIESLSINSTNFSLNDDEFNDTSKLISPTLLTEL